MPKKPDGCASPAGGPIARPAADQQPEKDTPERRVEMTVQVGKPAPDFEAAAYHEGGFKNIKLSDYKGQWVTLCFYPGDFTFV